MPPKGETSPNPRINVGLSPHLHEAVTQAAKDDSVTQSDIVRDAVELYLTVRDQVLNNEAIVLFERPGQVERAEIIVPGLYRPNRLRRRVQVDPPTRTPPAAN
jgi:SpoVK/Ycf46/Vps4 family AAA+-type ATPase